jgi:hypothetical protein
MSEYQYYEFRTADRQLTSREMASPRAISSRARITSTSFVNTYNYGDFRGDPEELMGKYFDAFVYVANWGTHEFMLRLPKKTLRRREYAPLCAGRCLRARIEQEHLVLSFRAEELETDWEEGEGWMDSLLPLRADLLRGDLRPRLACEAEVDIGTTMIDLHPGVWLKPSSDTNTTARRPVRSDPDRGTRSAQYTSPRFISASWRMSPNAQSRPTPNHGQGRDPYQPHPVHSVP